MVTNPDLPIEGKRDLIRLLRNRHTRELRALKKELGLCIEMRCEGSATDKVRCDKHLAIALAFQKRLQQRKAAMEPPKEPKPKTAEKREEKRVEHRFEGTDMTRCERCYKPIELHRTRRLKEVG